MWKSGALTERLKQPTCFIKWQKERGLEGVTVCQGALGGTAWNGNKPLAELLKLL